MIPPCEDTEVWIKFANLCRKSGKFHIGASVLKELLKIPKEKKIDVTNLVKMFLTQGLSKIFLPSYICFLKTKLGNWR